MAYGAPARTTPRRTPAIGVAGFVVIIAMIVGALGYRWLAPPSPSTPIAPLTAEPLVHRPPGSVPHERRDSIGAADGVVPDGVTVFDNDYPAVANLAPSLLGALRRAAADAARSGVTFYVDSGWRSRKYQEQLLDDAIAKYGSKAQAARWVATPDTSAHVSGEAVDIGHSSAAAWLSRHGAEYGLCQIYGNEPWHFELRPEAVENGCPGMYADPTHDPRMQR